MKPVMRVLGALGIGLAAGAIAGVLLAPGKGEDTRTQLRRKGEKMADRMKFNLKRGEKLASNIREDIEDGLNGIKQKANQFA